MSKKFDIHEWQAKQRLAEVQIKKVVDQSMNNADIGALMSIMRNYDLGKVLNTIAVIIDRTGGMPDGAAQMVADIVPKISPVDEVSMTGTGTTISTGGSEAYATPYSFKKKRKNQKVNELEKPIKKEPIAKADSPTTLAKKFKSLSSTIKAPMGAKGMDKAEIENLSLILDKILQSMKDGSTTTILKRILSIIPD